MQFKIEIIDVNIMRRGDLGQVFDVGWSDIEGLVNAHPVRNNVGFDGRVSEVNHVEGAGVVVVEVLDGGLNPGVVGVASVLNIPLHDARSTIRYRHIYLITNF
jgi:hypothetical protein